MVTNEQVAAHEGMVTNIAKSLNGCGIDSEDLKQAGYLGLIEAIERFDPTLGNQFSTYAYAYIRGYMLREIETNRKNACGHFDTDEDGNPIHQFAAQSSEDVHAVDTLTPALAGLTATERQVIAMRFGLDGYSGHTLDETGKALGVTKERARQLEKAALERMRAKIG